MITEEIILDASRLGDVEANRTHIIGVDTSVDKAFITLASTSLNSSGENAGIHIKGVFETSLELALRDLPDLVRDYNAKVAVVSIGPEMLWSKKVIESLNCKVKRCKYTIKTTSDQSEDVLNVQRSEVFDDLFEAFHSNKISVTKDFEGVFASQWVNQLTNVKRAYFNDRNKYRSVGPDNFFHSLVFSILAAKEAQ